MRTALATLLTLLLSGLVFDATPACAENQVAFTQEPTAVATKDGVKIEFAVNRESDVAVYVEDASGKIVRHLAAGVLGKNAPQPLKVGLSQTLLWDRRADDGELAEGGPFTIRVALGLEPQFDRRMFNDGLNISGINGLAVGPKGELFVKSTSHDGGMRVEDIRVLSREGDYLRTIAPYPAGLDYERVAPLGAFRAGDDGYLPRVQNLQIHGYYDVGILSNREMQMASDENGRLFFIAPWSFRGDELSKPHALCVCALDAQGGVPRGWTFKGKGLEGSPKSHRVAAKTTPHLAIGSNGKRIYISGISGSQVLWTDIEERGKTPVFCDGLKDPAGLATDGKGHLYVADYGAGRVVVFDEQSGDEIGEIAVPGANKVQVNRATGAVYVITQVGRKNELLKFSGEDDHKQLLRLTLPPLQAGKRAPFLAVSGGEQPAIWVGSHGWRNYNLLRISETDGEFGKPVEISKRDDLLMEDVFVDRPRNEVYILVGDKYWRFRDGDDQPEIFTPNVGGPLGTVLRTASNGNVYGFAYPNRLLRWDNDGKPVPFEKSGKNELVIPNTMTYQYRGLFLDPLRDELCLIQSPVKRKSKTGELTASPSGHKPPHVLRVYDLDGNLKRELLTRINGAAVGPRMDAAGNIYVGEPARPGSPALPKFFQDKVPAVENDDVPAESFPYSWGYGSIVKFSPRGGEILWTKTEWGSPINEEAYTGTLPEDVAKMNGPEFFAHITRTEFEKAPSKGVLWAHTGFFPATAASDLCNCMSAYFDVDYCGRVFYPDGARNRVTILDTNGNVVCHFGRYGNRDAVGKGDYIPLAMPVAVASTDRYLYVADVNNHSLIRAKKHYAAERTCKVR